MVDEEIEQIKKHTEQHYGVLPEINIQYSDKLLQSYTLSPLKLAEERLYQEILKEYGTKLATVDLLYLREKVKETIKRGLALQEKRLGIKIKIHPEKYTILLPTSTGTRTESRKRYWDYARLERKLERLKGEGPELEEVHAQKNLYSFLHDHPELWIYHCKGHEIGHVLGYSKNLFDDLNERVAILYGFKWLLLGAQKGKFKINEVKEMIKHTMRSYDINLLKNLHALIDVVNKSVETNLAYKDMERYNRVVRLVREDFNPDFKSLEKAIQDVERGISRYVEKKENIY